MKVQIENTSSFEKKIFFEIPREVVSQEVESTYRALNRNVKVKGKEIIGQAVEGVRGYGP